MRKFEEAQQFPGEFEKFIEVLLRENARSYLEIGSRLGGSLWRVAKALPVPAFFLSVDQPHGNRETEPHLKECIQEVRKLGHKAGFILGDSTNPEIVEQVRGRGPFDAVFIDANHTEPYVRKDWANYGPMGRIIAFHDINWKDRPGRSGKLPIDVPKVWDEIKIGFRHEEIRLDVRDNGIGILWRA